ncbi:type II toxin-antitoxin system PemK/MazF family toxin, partial [Candidatus Poribacteria bacterium]|nr:type II toxin-antitoxin system PemK/MazF family toxin [Candidatus Poribacteria bacterium]
MKRGNIVLAEFPFTDLKQEKLRPVIIISSDEINEIKEDITIGFISSSIHSKLLSSEYILVETNINFKE